jgi:hypothetical protein
MKDSVPLLRTIFDGTRTFLRDDFSDEAEFIRLVAEVRQLDALGFLKGYRENFSKDTERKLISVAVSRGLSDEGADYLVRIGGTTLGASD